MGFSPMHKFPMALAASNIECTVQVQLSLLEEELHGSDALSAYRRASSYFTSIGEVAWTPAMINGCPL